MRCGGGTWPESHGPRIGLELVRAGLDGQFGMSFGMSWNLWAHGPWKVEHVAVEDLWLQGAVKDHRIVLAKVLSASSPADLLTKYLRRSLIDRHVASLGLWDS